MAYWLFKTEPGDYSWERFIADQRTEWNGVRNHQAAANMRAMQAGERAFFYRSVKDPAVLGIMEIVRTAYAAPDDPAGKFVQVDVVPLEALPEPVTLAAIKATPELQDLALVRQSRLSVMPIADDAWRRICRMGGLET
ncbi:MAG: EVE domain-containing protein [Geminicoccaceae bacterium]|nr:MAG: EVE domain-containing protein [Geminicoccaceae bacterium]